MQARTAALLGLFGLAGCPPAGDPYVAILRPIDGEVVCGDPFEAQIELENFELADEYVANPEDVEDGVGHAHFYLNGQSTYESTTTDVVFDEPVADGPYQLKVELANTNHAPVEPYVSDLIYITVDNTLCGAAR